VLKSGFQVALRHTSCVVRATLVQAGGGLNAARFTITSFLGHEKMSLHFNGLCAVLGMRAKTREPAGRFNTLKMLAAGVEGNQESQVFTVTYVDGTSCLYTQSLSDWYTPEKFGGESEAARTPYRLEGGGARDDRTFYLYGYSFPLEGKKTVRSIIVPPNGNVLVFALALVRGSSGDGDAVH
jgi:hypothetical protein